MTNKYDQVRKVTPLVWAIRLILIICILSGSVSLAMLYIMNRPKPQERQIEKRAQMVRVTEVTPQNYQAMIEVMGRVVPVDSVNLRSRVSGEILYVADTLKNGRVVRKGEVLIKLDRADYELAVNERQQALAQAEASLALEQGQRGVALREVEMMEKQGLDLGENRSLALREPQLKMAQAKVTAAQVALDKAKLDLARTEIVAPFDAIVAGETVEVGGQLSVQDSICQLIGIKTFWVEAVVPKDRLQYLSFKEDGATGSKVTIRDDQQTFIGEVLRVLPRLNARDNQSRVLVEVQNPWKANQKLLLDSFVNLIISGPVLEEVFVLPRQVLQEGTWLYVVDEKKQLEIRACKPMWLNRDLLVCKEPLQIGDEVITSTILNPVEGMLLRPESAEEVDDE